MADELSIIEITEVDASPADVWAAIANPQVLATWWPGMNLTVVEGATLTEQWADELGIERETSGIVVECTPGERFVLVWADSDWPTSTRVEISIQSLSPSRAIAWWSGRELTAPDRLAVPPGLVSRACGSPHG